MLGSITLFLILSVAVISGLANSKCAIESFSRLASMKCPNMKGFAGQMMTEDKCAIACCTSGLSNYTGICDTFVYNPNE